METSDSGSARSAKDAAQDAKDTVRDAKDEVAQAVKPRLRGWLHAGMIPLSVGAGILMVTLAPTPRGRIATAVFAVTAVLLFGTSAVYHRGRWSPRVAGVLRRVDHANIFLIIAGTYTPFTLLLLHRTDARLLLTLVWLGALVGVAFRVLWLQAPRWLYVPVYVALGWAAAFWIPDFFRSGRLTVFALIFGGGLLYFAGAIVYALRRPNPSPRWFGFHEIFHSFTVAAFAAHVVGVSLVVAAN